MHSKKPLRKINRFYFSRKKVGPGCLGGVEMKFKKSEERREKRRADELTRLEKLWKTIGKFMFFSSFILFFITLEVYDIILFYLFSEVDNV